jgi:hypothetical protein
MRKQKLEPWSEVADSGEQAHTRRLKLLGTRRPTPTRVTDEGDVPASPIRIDISGGRTLQNCDERVRNLDELAEKTLDVRRGQHSAAGRLLYHSLILRCPYDILAQDRAMQ